MPNKTSLKNQTTIASCAFAVNATSEIQLLPAGEFRASDGRPHDVAAWLVNAEIADAIIKEVSSRSNRVVIDYEHQTLLSNDNGKPAPAAGWFKSLEWREGDGLYAIDVKWTKSAAGMIENQEYLYISPVFAYDSKSGSITYLLNAALTNTPALDGMSEVVLMAASRLIPPNIQPKQEQTMPEIDDLRSANAVLTAEVVSLKAKGDAPDPAKFVPVNMMQDLQNQVAALTTEKNIKEVDAIVTAALAGGKLLPAQEAWARDLGKANLAALSVYVKTAQPIAALVAMQSNGKPPGDVNIGALSDDQLAVCKQLGVAQEAFLAQLTKNKTI